MSPQPNSHPEENWESVLDQKLKRLPNRPKTGFTLGMRDILSSRLVLLVVSGAQKQRVLQRVLQPRVSTGLPASFLWLHPNARVLCDRAAAGLVVSQDVKERWTGPGGAGADVQETARMEMIQAAKFV